MFGSAVPSGPTMRTSATDGTEAQMGSTPANGPVVGVRQKGYSDGHMHGPACTGGTYAQIVLAGVKVPPVQTGLTPRAA